MFKLRVAEPDREALKGRPNRLESRSAPELWDRYQPQPNRQKLGRPFEFEHSLDGHRHGRERSDLGKHLPSADDSGGTIAQHFRPDQNERGEDFQNEHPQA